MAALRTFFIAIAFIFTTKAWCVDFDFDLDFSYNWRNLEAAEKARELDVSFFDSRLSLLYRIPRLPVKIGLSQLISEPWQREKYAAPYSVTLYETSVELAVERTLGRAGYALFSRYIFRREFFYSYEEHERGFRRVYHGPLDFGFAFKYALVPVARLLIRLEYQKGGFFLAPREDEQEIQVKKMSVGAGFEFSI